MTVESYHLAKSDDRSPIWCVGLDKDNTVNHTLSCFFPFFCTQPNYWHSLLHTGGMCSFFLVLCVSHDAITAYIDKIIDIIINYTLFIILTLSYLSVIK